VAEARGTDGEAVTELVVMDGRAVVGIGIVAAVVDAAVVVVVAAVAVVVTVVEDDNDDDDDDVDVVGVVTSIGCVCGCENDKRRVEGDGSEEKAADESNEL
jgi:hypothetical protein